MDELDYAEMVVLDTEDDGDRDDKDFDSRQTHETGSTKSNSANKCGNTSKRRKESADATESEVKKTSNRLLSEKDELTLLKAKQTSGELRKLKRKYQKMKSKMKERNLSLRDSHPQELLGESSKILKENNGGIKSDEIGEEGKKDEDFYPSLLRNSLADRGLDFASLNKPTESILVEDWNDLMLASNTYELLKAKFDKKIHECICGVYEAFIKKLHDSQHS